MDPFDRLLSQMPAIAKAVNEFTSEQVQQQAFRALIGALGGEAAPERDDEAADPGVAAGAGESKGRTSTRRRTRAKAAAAPEGEATTGSATRRRAVAASPTFDKNLDLHPKGAQSFADFVDFKKPTSDHEKSLVAVYYLTMVLNVTATVDAVYTCYKDRKWRVPTNLRNSIPLTATKKGWLITKNLDDLKVAVPGENYVEHDLPAKTAKS